MKKQHVIIVAIYLSLGIVTGYLFNDVLQVTWQKYAMLAISVLLGVLLCPYLIKFLLLSGPFYSLEEYVNLLKTVGNPPEGTDDFAETFKRSIEFLPAWYRKPFEDKMDIAQWGVLYQSWLYHLKAKVKSYAEHRTTL